MRLLLFTNGSASSGHALRFGATLATALKAPVHVIGLSEDDGAALPAELTRIMEETVRAIQAARLPVEARMVPGKIEAVVRAEAVEADDLVVIGPLGRRGWRRWLRGPSIRHIMRDLPRPAIYVASAPPEEIRRILICSGGLSHSEAAIHLGGRLAAALKVPATLLHIVVPIAHVPGPVQDQSARPADYLKGDSIYARNLRHATEGLEEQRVQVDFRLRQGDPLLEILAEIRSGGYDLVTIGSHSVLSGPARLVGDITVRIVEGAGCPVLVAPGPPQSPHG